PRPPRTADLPPGDDAKVGGALLLHGRPAHRGALGEARHALAGAAECAAYGERTAAPLGVAHGGARQADAAAGEPAGPTPAHALRVPEWQFHFVASAAPNPLQPNPPHRNPL